ncbi:MAG: DNA mismatch repair protein MutS [Clostridia bacterium]|nr:DNA mismatch repair protein MutS [Clostridia bacterium]
MALSPMMQQYLNTKEQNKDCILFFRLGDFYEMFFDDAVLVSKELELTLTGKSCGLEERAPMCGVPYHAAENYIAKLVNRGYKVAICEQMEDPALVKGLVKREVVQIVTPGTVTSNSMLSEKESNYLCCVYMGEKNTGIAYCDVSTGELRATSVSNSPENDAVLNELVCIRAKEILINEQAKGYLNSDEITLLTDASVSFCGEEYFAQNHAEIVLKKQFGVASLEGIGLSESPECMTACGALFAYLEKTQKRELSHLIRLQLYTTGNHMSLDKATIRNLEITETLYDKNTKGSLFGVLDKTHTAMGSRKMKKWLREPLCNVEEINLRLDAVEALCDDVITRNNLKESLKKIYDLERLSGRLACGNANAKDLIALRNSLYFLPEIKSDTESSDSELLKRLSGEIRDLSDIYNMIDEAVVEDPPFTLTDGGIIKDGFSEELDGLKESIADAKKWITELEPTEKERTGIKNLKVSFNKVFGYYIEVSKSNLGMIPENYIRKQTLVNAERFITPELKQMEGIVLNAETKINRLEYDIFCSIRKEIMKSIRDIQLTADAVAAIDVLYAFAEVSSEMNYVKPEVNGGREILIEQGRHPVLEKMIKDGVFISNDIYLNDKESALLLITGPNMAGKSTYMRQTALIVLMAQTGCFVPAARAKIGAADRIFTRIGASDNLSQGQSTFYVEMSELAFILNSATEKSLIILDEIGRGTSTYDGLSIAWAVTEYLTDKRHRARTLFATHYHELTVLEGKLDGVKNLSVDVAEENGNIVFLHKIIEGSANRSYGIHVARLAGVPAAIYRRADEKLSELEEASETMRSRINLSFGVSGGMNDFAGEKVGVSRKNSKENKSGEAGTGNDAGSGNGDSDSYAGSGNGDFDSYAGSGNGGFGNDDTGNDTDGGRQLSFFSFAPNPVVERLRKLDLMNIKPSEAFQILEELKEAAEKQS